MTQACKTRQNYKTSMPTRNIEIPMPTETQDSLATTSKRDSVVGPTQQKQIRLEGTALQALDKRRRTLHQGRVCDQSVWGIAEDSIISNVGGLGHEHTETNTDNEHESRLPSPAKPALNVTLATAARRNGGSLTQRGARLSLFTSGGADFAKPTQ